jgi:hypothetical protein
MKLGKPGSSSRSGRRKLGPIRVSYVQQKGHRLVMLLRFTSQVIKDARWKIGDILDVEMDDSGNVTVARSAQGWMLSGKSDTTDGTIRLTVYPDDLKALHPYAIPADIQDYAEDGGAILFQLPKSSACEAQDE